MKKHPLIDDAIKRNEDALIHTTPGSPQYQEYKNRIERHRHESIMAMLEDISKPKKIEIFIAVVTFFAFLIATVQLFRPNREVVVQLQQNADLTQSNDKKGVPAQSKSPIPAPKSNNAESHQKSTITPPKTKIDTK